MSTVIPKKIDLKPKRYHFYNVLLFVLGTLFPPLAVAARFGLGGDFWLNLLLTICGYIPGHGHNFYIQNIRNNKNHKRTPKWAQRYGLVDTSEIQRKQRKSQWAGRYNERTARSALEGQAYEDGQVVPEGPDNLGGEARPARPDNELWNPEEERFYGGRDDRSSSTAGGSGAGRWHYPANFEDIEPGTPVEGGAGSDRRKKKKKEKKDRWARTEDAYSIREGAEGGRSSRRRSKKSRRSDANGDTYSARSGSTTNFPEDAEGGVYGNSEPRRSEPPAATQRSEGNEFDHQF